MLFKYKNASRNTGSIKDISDLISQCGILGASAGSLFVFKGIYRAVLINYPDSETKRNIIECKV